MTLSLLLAHLRHDASNQETTGGGKETYWLAACDQIKFFGRTLENGVAELVFRSQRSNEIPAIVTNAHTARRRANENILVPFYAGVVAGGIDRC
jgi:hypothetical protein